MAASTSTVVARKLAGLDRSRLLHAYRSMVLSRRLDEKQIVLHRQGRTYFQLSASGHEAFQVAAAMALKPGYDWFFPYYRDQALAVALGFTPLDLLLEAVGSSAAPFSGGRQMPNHWGSPALHVVSRSSAVGTQFLHAVGCAEAGIYYQRMSAGTPPPSAPQLQQDSSLSSKLTSKLSSSFEADEVVCVLGGDGSTSEGEFFESLNTACHDRLPVLYLIENNGYAISTPVEEQTAGGNSLQLVSGYPNLYREETDGTDFVESLEALQRAVAHCRERKGPAIVQGHLFRLHSHSLSDDQRLYKSSREIAEETLRDPLPKLAARLETEGLLSAKDRAALEQEVDTEIEHAAEQALVAPGHHTDKQSSHIERHVFSIHVDPTSRAFDHPAQFSGEPLTMVESLNACLRDELRRDPRVLLYGQDIADCGSEQTLPEVKGKGGVFKVTHGLQREFGKGRVFNAPIAEANIVGRAIGYGLRGLKPVVEIQFFDYIWPAMMQIRDEMSVMRWRSNGNFGAPAVIRAAYGGYLSGGSIYHSQCGESIFAHIPGLRVVLPSNAADANGLLRTAIRCDDPVLFLEHKHLYRQTYNRSPYPGPDYMIPFGRANIVREGRDATVITYGALVQKSLQAAQKLAEEGMSVEVVDLRCLSPFDWDTVAASVRKTSRALVAQEDNLSFGYASEIAARISEEMFHELDAPVKRVGALDTFVAYHPTLEKQILPQASDIEAALRDLAAG
ncbi:MAG: dehydrogenase [Acidobacteria bacterium]|nr:dehydrogenase [Acidobacteriota bacterium]